MQVDHYAIHVGPDGLPDGHIGVCPIDRSALFFSNTTHLGRYALCRRGHTFDVGYTDGRYGHLVRLVGVSSKEIRGW